MVYIPHPTFNDASRMVRHSGETWLHTLNEEVFKPKCIDVQLNKQNLKFGNLQYWSIMFCRVPDQECRDVEVAGIDTVEEAMLL